MFQFCSFWMLNICLIMTTLTQNEPQLRSLLHAMAHSAPKKSTKQNFIISWHYGPSTYMIMRRKTERAKFQQRLVATI